jgi:hypothetical protein
MWVHNSQMCMMCHQKQYTCLYVLGTQYTTGAMMNAFFNVLAHFVLPHAS